MPVTNVSVGKFYELFGHRVKVCSTRMARTGVRRIYYSCYPQCCGSYYCIKGSLSDTDAKIFFNKDKTITTPKSKDVRV